MSGGLFLAWAIMAASFAANPPEPPPRDPHNLTDVRDHFRYPGVEVSIEWHDCGYPNAFYVWKTRTVEMCNELLDMDPRLVRFFFAHEMAHAVIDQLSIPIVVSEEAAADELAAYVMVLSGNADDVGAAADWFATKHVNGHRVHPMDDHPDHLKRAVTLKCYSIGQAGARFCPRNWNRVVWAWNRLLPAWED